MKSLVALVLIAGLIAEAGAQQRPSSPTGSIEGVVLDSVTGEPVPGVVFKLETEGASYNPFTGPAAPTAYSDAHGQFAFDLLSAGAYRMSTNKAGYMPAKPEVRKAAGAYGLLFNVAPNQKVQDVVIHITASSVISGRVVDTAGALVSGVRVAARRPSFDEFGEETDIEVKFAVTNDRGEFRIFNLDPGEFDIVASELNALSRTATSNYGHRELYYPGVGDRSNEETVIVRPGEELRLHDTVMPLMQTVPIHIRLVNETGVPYPRDIEFRVWPKGAVAVSSISMDTPSLDETDPSSWNPRNMSAKVLPGAYIIYAGGGFPGVNSFVFAATTLEAKAGEEPTVSLILPKRVRLSGHAILKGSSATIAPLPGLVARMVLAHPPLPGIALSDFLLNARTGIDGKFSFDVSPSEYRLIFSGLPDDAYLISAKQDGTDILSGTMQVSGDSDLEVVAASNGGVLNGIVRNVAGTSISGAMVVMVPESSLRNRGDLYRSATSDQEGKFVLHGIAPGTYKVFAWIDAEGIAPFRNAQFIEKYEEHGKEIQIATGQHATTFIQIADDEP